jgi:hypothetical protein
MSHIKIKIGFLCASLKWLAAMGAASAEVNVPTDEASKILYDPRTKSDMDDLAGADEVAACVRSLKSDWTLFVEDRAHSIRKSATLPKRWLADTPGHTRTFKGTA